MEGTKKRNGFGSGIGFILAAAGSAVGLGNLWSFPYKTSANGGAAFVFVYILCVILFGSIVMTAEIYIGRRAQANPITAYKSINKKMGWLGLFAIIIPTFILCYYSVLGGYTVKFTVNSFKDNSTVLSTYAGDFVQVSIFTAIFLILSLVVVMGGIKNGIEKASKVLMPALFILLIAIVIYCLCLGEGVTNGLEFYLNPKFDELGFSGVLAAMGQAFYSLSLGMGIMVSYGSYTSRESNLGKSVLMICIFDTCVAFLSGLAIFPSIFHYEAVSGTPVSDMQGMMLMFKSLPLVFAKLGFAGKIISFLFFGMVVIAALTSVVSLLEVATQFIIQKFKMPRKRATLMIFSFAFIVSIFIGVSLGYALTGQNKMLICGENWLDFFDKVTNTVLMPLCALGSCFVLGWLLDKKPTFSPFKTLKVLKDDGLNLGKFEKIFAVMVKYATPILILIIEVFGVKDIIFPNGVFSVNGLGIVLTAYAILLVCVAIYFAFLRNKETGTNEDELLMQSDSKKANE